MPVSSNVMPGSWGESSLARTRSSMAATFFSRRLTVVPLVYWARASMARTDVISLSM